MRSIERLVKISRRSKSIRRQMMRSIVKRSVDLAMALGVVAIFWWLLALIWVSVRASSVGPGVFRQVRIGRYSQVFTCYKFRTMYVDAPNAATHELSHAWVTPVGRLLRRSKLDELPQIFNVLKSEMSIVGPRPGLLGQSLLTAERYRLGVLEAKPGITGLAQVRGIDMSNPVLLAKIDQDYILRQCLALDVKIIIATGLGSGFAKSMSLDRRRIG